MSVKSSSCKLLQIHRIFTKDPGINTLIEIHSPLEVISPAPKSGATFESKVNDFSDDIFEVGRGHHIVVHQDDVVARTQVVLVIGCSTSDLDT